MPIKIISNGESALLVDDHPDVLVSVGAFLEAAGFDVLHRASLPLTPVPLPTAANLAAIALNNSRAFQLGARIGF